MQYISLIHHQGIICGVAFDPSFLRRIAPTVDFEYLVSAIFGGHPILLLPSINDSFLIFDKLYIPLRSIVRA